jgi:hypothetical protein
MNNFLLIVYRYSPKRGYYVWGAYIKKQLMGNSVCFRKIRKIGVTILFLVLFFVFYSCFSYRSVKYFPIEINYQKKWGQGMAIHGQYVFLLTNTGLCRIYDMRKGGFAGSLVLASAHAKNHANNACFGVEYSKDNNKFPALYVSECEAPYRCYVENITEYESRLIQIIQFRIGNKPQAVHDWIVDRETNHIYAITQLYPFNKERNGFATQIVKFGLPSIDTQEVILSDVDIEDSFEVFFPHILQGGVIHNHALYLPSGASADSQVQYGKEKAIVIIDLKEKGIKRIIDVQNILNNEPEGAAFWGKFLMVSCAPKGLYQFFLKDE